jgi:TetR/AcrR family transcriptional regulator
MAASILKPVSSRSRKLVASGSDRSDSAPETRNLPRSRNAAASRVHILEQAIAEFATQGVAGARTAAIAEAAGVNKALLYYYFKDKESLYSAALEAVFGGFVDELMPMLSSALPPGEKLLRFARAHFEYLIAHPHYPRLIQQELSRAGNREAAPGAFQSISAAHFIPLHRAGLRVLEQGVASGELRPVEGASALGAVIGMNVFYFISAPIMRAVRGVDPLFADRRRGIALAERIASEPSAPQRAQGGKKGKAEEL